MLQLFLKYSGICILLISDADNKCLMIYSMPVIEVLKSAEKLWGFYSTFCRWKFRFTVHISFRKHSFLCQRLLRLQFSNSFCGSSPYFYLARTRAFRKKLNKYFLCKYTVGIARLYVSYTTQVTLQLDFAVSSIFETSKDSLITVACLLCRQLCMACFSHW